MPQNSPLATTLTDRAVIRVSGEDVCGFLQGLVTQDVAGGLPVWAGLLTAQGKCLFDFLVWPDDGNGQDLLLDCESAAADDLIKRLTLYRLRRPIAVERDDGLAVHWASEGDQGVADPRLAELTQRYSRGPTRCVDELHAEIDGRRVRRGLLLVWFLLIRCDLRRGLSLRA